MLFRLILLLPFIATTGLLKSEESIEKSKKPANVYLQSTGVARRLERLEVLHGHEGSKARDDRLIFRDAQGLKSPLEKEKKREKENRVKEISSDNNASSESIIRLDPIRIIGMLRVPSIKFTNEEPQIEISEPDLPKDFIKESGSESLGL